MSTRGGTPAAATSRCPELGWLKTPALFEEAPTRIKRDLTVVTAVAVSGAAFASAMGRHQKGFEKLLAVSGAQ
jgi:hypothetical protein